VLLNAVQTKITQAADTAMRMQGFFFVKHPLEEHAIRRLAESVILFKVRTFEQTNEERRSSNS
jgi:hypothetical protein